MATAVDSTRTPVVQTSLLPFTFRPVPPVDDPRSAVELLDEIRRTIEGQVVCSTVEKAHDVPHGVASDLRHGMMTHVDSDTPAPELPPEPLLSAVADLARICHMRRELERAADHGVALLAALGLPRLVDPDFVRHDTMAVGDALDVIISHLDALDAPDEDREPWLAGDYNGRVPLDAEADHATGFADDEDDGLSEPSLGAPERHPAAMLMFGGGFTDRSANCRQTRWADGGRQDHEGEITDEPHDGDNEDLEAEPAEPNLGATEITDQTAWGESGDHDREFDATDCIDRRKTVAQYEPTRARRGDMIALTRKAEALRRKAVAHAPALSRPDPDALILVHGRTIDGHAMAMWGGPVARLREAAP